MRHCSLSSLVLLAVVIAAAEQAGAQQQQVTNATPFSTANNSFFERSGISWGLSRPAQGNMGPISLNVGGFQTAVPQFGNFAPGAGITGGAGFRPGGGWSANFFGEFSQGNRSSLTSVTPSVTTLNGQTGFVADQSQSPFVISVIPVVGSRGPFNDYGAANTIRGRAMRGEFVSLQNALNHGSQAPNLGGNDLACNNLGRIDQGADLLERAPVQAPAIRQKAPVNRDPLVIRSPGPAPAAIGGGGGAQGNDSSAEQAVEGIEEIRARQAALREAKEQNQRAEALTAFEKGQLAEAEGKFGAARVHYQMALSRAAGPLKLEVQQRLSAVSAGK